MQIFQDNKYTKWYLALVEKRKQEKPEGYTEVHHVIPKGMGGTDDSKNLVALTAREHFIAHLLLRKAVIKKFQASAIHSSWLMVNMNKLKINSVVYESVRRDHAKMISARLTGIIRSPETRMKMSKPKSETHRRNISLGRTGIIFSSKQRELMSLACKGKKWVNNKSETKMVTIEEMKSLLQQGWTAGRKVVSRG